MKSKITILSLFFMIWSFAQTTVRFSEPHRFFDASEKILCIKILVNNIDKYNSDTPIILQLYSDLEDINIIGITKTHIMDKVILPQQYKDGEEIRLSINIKALKDKKKFNLFIKKQGDNKHFKILEDRLTVILDQSTVDKSYLGISATSPNNTETDFIKYRRIEIPFKIEITGDHLPVASDEVIIRIKINDIYGNDYFNTFKSSGAVSYHKFLVEKSKAPGLYKKLKKALAVKDILKLEISSLKHNAQHHIEVDPSKKSIRFNLKKTDTGNARLQKNNSIVAGLKKTDSLNVSYSFYAGVNFDFNNNFKFEEAYYEMDVSLYNLFKNRWGLRAVIYKNNNSRSLAEDFHYKWVHHELFGHNESNIVYTQKTLDIVTNVSIESLGFYFELPYKVIESGQFSAFVSPHIEAIKRIERYTYEIVGESTKTAIVVPLDFPVVSLNYAPLWQESITRYWDNYFGVGFPMIYRSPDKGFEVFMNPILGAGYPRKSADNVIFHSGNNRGMSPFGIFQFYLAVSTKETLGIKLGTDVRKFFGAGQRPTISVNLSTKLDLSGITSLTREK